MPQKRHIDRHDCIIRADVVGADKTPSSVAHQRIDLQTPPILADEKPVASAAWKVIGQNRVAIAAASSCYRVRIGNPCHRILQGNNMAVKQPPPRLRLEDVGQLLGQLSGPFRSTQVAERPKERHNR
jgi:hypothetical protein